jgi:4-amino-4-deoxy-L-arabinose transferase-like glycosyltransferase
MDAQTVLADGCWCVPRLFDGRAELQKPPLYYWLVAGIAWLRGVSVDAWAVRLPAAGSALACVLLVGAGLTWGCGRALAGLLAAVVLASAAHFTWLARIGRIDMPLALCVSLAAGGFYLGKRCERGGRRWMLQAAAYLGCAAGLLLKGPVAVVLPAAVLAAHLGMEGELPAPWRWRAWGQLLREQGVSWGVLLVLTLTLPWFVWAEMRTGGEFGRVFFWHHNVERGLGGGGLRSNPWWLYGPLLAGDFLPWSPLLVLAWVGCFRFGWLRDDPEARFGLAWLAAVTVVLSCSSFKRADYLLPAYPGAAIFLGCLCARRGREEDERWPWRLLRGEWVVGLAAVMVGVWGVRLYWTLPGQEPGRDYRALAAEVRRRAPAPEEVLFFRTEAHALAFHVGRPLAVVVEWPELEARLAGSGGRYVVMPPECVREWPRFLSRVRLEEVLRNTDLSGGWHERPLVLLRVRPGQTEN